MTLQFNPDRKGAGISKPLSQAAVTQVASRPKVQPETAAELEGIRQRIIEAIGAGELDKAEKLSAQALDLARRAGSQYDIDRCECNRANVLVSIGRGEEVVAPMRKLLLRSADTGNRFAAAYAIAQHHFNADENERSMFYARQALRYAEEKNEPEFLAKCNNLVATLLLQESYFTEASTNFEEALKFYPAGYERAGIQANLGYCLTVVGKITLAFRHLVASLRMMNRLHLGPWRRVPHLMLAYAYLEIGRHGRAIQHAGRALELSIGVPGAEVEHKNSLYLLGEAKKLIGRDTEAYEHFIELQKDFYPEQPFIVDVLMMTDVRKMINLTA